MRIDRALLAAFFVATLGAGGCDAFLGGHLSESVRGSPPERRTVDGREPVLKAHMEAGDVYVFDQWDVETSSVEGRGVHYDRYRNAEGKGEFEVELDEVALFETNVLKPTGGLISMSVITGLSAMATGLCLVNPKTCYGSCPTFYAGRREAGDRPDAEGFSSSVTPSLEATDVDRLSGLEAKGGRATVEMTNEAMETHVVRRLELLAVPSPEGNGAIGRTTDGEFRRLLGRREPTSCRAENGDCRRAIRRKDDTAWESEADAENLAARETLELTFDAEELEEQGDLGLELRFRQKFVTTFLFYQFLSDLGEQAVDVMAELERTDGAERAFQNIADTVGGIEVRVRGRGEWRTVGEAREAGPLAANTHVVELPEDLEAELRVQLRLAKGNWRIDSANLVSLGEPVEARRLQPVEATYAGRHEGRPAERVLEQVSTEDDVLATRPGDSYVFEFELPESPEDWAYFVKSRGYYLEWMREKWLDDQNLWRAGLMMSWPERAFRELAPAFKEREPTIERKFWNSRYGPDEK